MTAFERGIEFNELSRYMNRCRIQDRTELYNSFENGLDFALGVISCGGINSNNFHTDEWQWRYNNSDNKVRRLLKFSLKKRYFSTYDHGDVTNRIEIKKSDIDILLLDMLKWVEDKNDIFGDYYVKMYIYKDCMNENERNIFNLCAESYNPDTFDENPTIQHTFKYIHSNYFGGKLKTGLFLEYFPEMDIIINDDIFQGEWDDLDDIFKKWIQFNEKKKYIHYDKKEIL